MSKHTPGPWSIDWYVCREGKKELWRVPRSIGPVHINHNHWAGNHLDISDADARLIAAAPDLLRALQNLTHALELGDLLHDDQRTAFHDARAAIAKATGEQP